MNTGRQWEWTLSATLTVIGLAITLGIAIAGWVMTAIKDSRNAKAAREKYEADVRRADEMNATLKSQLEAARESAEALRAQVEQLKEANRIADDANPFTSVPWGDAEWTGHGSRFTIRNKSSRNVVVVNLSASDEKLDGLMHFRPAAAFHVRAELQNLVFGVGDPADRHAGCRNRMALGWFRQDSHHRAAEHQMIPAQFTHPPTSS